MELVLANKANATRLMLWSLMYKKSLWDAFHAAKSGVSRGAGSNWWEYLVLRSK